MAPRALGASLILNDSIWDLKGGSELDRTDENGKNFSGKEKPTRAKVS